MNWNILVIKDWVCYVYWWGKMNKTRLIKFFYMLYCIWEGFLKRLGYLCNRLKLRGKVDHASPTTEGKQSRTHNVSLLIKVKCLTSEDIWIWKLLLAKAEPAICVDSEVVSWEKRWNSISFLMFEKRLKF